MPIILYTAGFKPFLQIVIGDAFSQNKKALRRRRKANESQFIGSVSISLQFQLFDAQDTAEERSFGQAHQDFHLP
ncbi:Uncharacterised protein [Bacillus subtilis]|nr:hypothetical protein NRS6185_01381 [Bacillus subtilis]SNY65141.1 hypothetical protein SAMN02744790_01621 [Bacillus subtilis]SPY12307.1 Uncharacterised protein [Bacillus subtilis]